MGERFGDRSQVNAVSLKIACGSTRDCRDQKSSPTSRRCVRPSSRTEGRPIVGRDVGGQLRTTWSTAGKMRWESGMYSISSVYGNGVSKPVTRTGGACR